MLTKQEKIREGIASRLWRRASLPGINIEWEELSPFAKECWLYLADGDMEILHSQGVVIKVERELPELPIYQIRDSEYTNIKAVAYLVQQDMLKAGFTAWEPLKEVKDASKRL